MLLINFWIAGDIVYYYQVVRSIKGEEISGDFLPRILWKGGWDQGLSVGGVVSSTLWALLDKLVGEVRPPYG